MYVRKMMEPEDLGYDVEEVGEMVSRGRSLGKAKNEEEFKQDKDGDVRILIDK